MKLTEFFLAQLEREAAKSRKVLERVPEGRNDWKPHEKSMRLGYLATLVGTMPSWVALMIDQDELNLSRGSEHRPQEMPTTRELLNAFEESVKKGRSALEQTTDDHLMTSWKLLAGGQVVTEEPRYVVLAEAFSHMSHHRGQLTVYLRLNDAPVPAIFGPSADEGGFS